MNRRCVVVERYADHQALAVGFPQRQQPVLHLAHGPHGIGEHQGAQATIQHVAQHAHDLRVHERLSAGEPDEPREQPVVGYLIEVGPHLRAAEIGQAVVAR